MVQVWIRLYGTETARAAEWTTPHFRNGKSVQDWAAALQPRRAAIGYAHLGGEIMSVHSSGACTMVTIQARIAAVDGISLQEERYLLKRERGQWLIDALEIAEEVVPGEKRHHAC